MREWYYVVDGEQQGPLSEEELRNILSSGRLPTATLVWTEQMPDWLEANQVDGLLVKAPPGVPTSEPAPDSEPVAVSAAAPAFLFISINRLVTMSILSCGLYEVYWIYKNWRYLKERDGLKIRPFWRGWFGIFHCHSLLTAIHTDRELTRVEAPTFSPGGLAAAWIILVLLANAVGHLPGVMASAISFVIPSFLCLVPVQNYINRVNQLRTPQAKQAGWSTGHMVCLGLGLFLWAMTLMTIGEPV